MIEEQYIEGQTPLDFEEKLDLIPNIFTRQDLDAFEQENIIEARVWVMRKKTLSSINIFTERFVVSLHKRMYGKVWKWAGKYRKINKNIGVEYYMIPVELKNLLDDAEYWLSNKIYDICDLAIIFHHRLVKIHLFPNGNGRHARLCADIITAKYGAKKLSWGNELNLVKASDIRKKHISALRAADKGSYDALIQFAKS